MRFLVDESTGPGIARWLSEQGHDVFSVYEANRGADDDTIIKKAFDENWILITNDKDFGEKVYREQHSHHGVILLRLEDERKASKISILERVISDYGDQLSDQFFVVTENRIRIAHK